MENKIEIDFSKLEEISVSKPTKTICAICVTCVLNVAIVANVINKDMAEWNSIVSVCLMLAFCLLVLCFILYKLESIQIAHEIEIKRAVATLRLKLAEEAIMREIKIREKEISDAQKYKQEFDRLKDLEYNLNNLKLLSSVKNDDDRKKEINNIIKSLENKLSELKR